MGLCGHEIGRHVEGQANWGFLCGEVLTRTYVGGYEMKDGARK